MTRIAHKVYFRFIFKPLFSSSASHSLNYANIKIFSVEGACRTLEIPNKIFIRTGSTGRFFFLKKNWVLNERFDF